MSISAQRLRHKVKAITTYRVLAEKLKWPYQTLSHKLGGFAPLSLEEKEKILSVLEKIASES